MAKYYMANTVFQPYAYEQLYTTAKDLTAAHNEQEAKLGALDAMATGVEPYLDPEKHPEDQQMYDTLQNYRKGLGDITYHLASRGLSGHVYNNVMSLAADYSGKVKPIESAVENYKKAHDMRVALMTQNPDYIPRYSWDDINISENMNGASQRAVEGFKGTQYMNDITTTLKQLFNDFGLTKRNDIRIFGQQVYDYISNGMPVETALNWFADQTNLSPEDRAKMMLGISTINQRYGIDSLKETNPAILSELAGYQKQGVINAIGTHEMKTYKNLWDEVAASVSQARRIKALDNSGQITQTPVLGGTSWTAPTKQEELKNDIDVNRSIYIPGGYNAKSTAKPSEFGDTFYSIMKDELGKVDKRFVKFADKSPEEISDINWWEKNWQGLNKKAQKAYQNAYEKACRARSYIQNKNPYSQIIDTPSTITNFLTHYQNKLVVLDEKGNIDYKLLSKQPKTATGGLWANPESMEISFIPSVYSIMNGVETNGKSKNDYVFFKVKNQDSDNVTTLALPIEELIGTINTSQWGFSPRQVVDMFNEFKFGDNYDYFHAKYPSERELQVLMTDALRQGVVDTYYHGREEEKKSIK